MSIGQESKPTWTYIDIVELNASSNINKLRCKHAPLVGGVTVTVIHSFLVLIEIIAHTFPMQLPPTRAHIIL